MMRDRLKHAFMSAIHSLVEKGELPDVDYPEIEFADPRDPSHGDFACNFAMMATKKAGKPPRAVAELISQSISDPLVQSIDIAGPGFMNIWLSKPVANQVVKDILNQGVSYAKVKNPNPKRINVEFVSVNPNGPITVGSGRGAAFGSTYCNVQEAAGNIVHREYYVNDGVNSEQMRQFALSVKALAHGQPVPEKGYKGDYVQAVAEQVRPMAEASGWPEDALWWQEKSQELMLEKQKLDLKAFGVEFDTWFSEQSLHVSGAVAQEVEQLQKSGTADDEPYRTKLTLAKGGKVEDVVREEQPSDEDDAEGSGKTLWLRSTKFGDDMDRVLRRKDGRLTYISSDVAYHKDKFNRPPNADKLVTILGPDHHGYIMRLHAVVAAVLGASMDTSTQSQPTEVHELFKSAEEQAICEAALALSKEKLEVVIFQIVRFVRDGNPAPMRKRDGNIYALIDLIEEVGKTMAPEADQSEQQRIGRDVARFFYLMRSHDTHMDFDIDLATKKSDENPVFYVQYAHARICSILRKAEMSDEVIDLADLSLLTHGKELDLVKKIADLPYEIERCAGDNGVHRLTTYAQELARTYHNFYGELRVIQPDEPEIMKARLALCKATKIGLQAVFGILGISAPEAM